MTDVQIENVIKTALTRAAKAGNQKAYDAIVGMLNDPERLQAYIDSFADEVIEKALPDDDMTIEDTIKATLLEAVATQDQELYEALVTMLNDPEQMQAYADSLSDDELTEFDKGVKWTAGVSPKTGKQGFISANGTFRTKLPAGASVGGEQNKPAPKPKNQPAMKEQADTATPTANPVPKLGRAKAGPVADKAKADAQAILTSRKPVGATGLAEFAEHLAKLPTADLKAMQAEYGMKGGKVKQDHIDRLVGFALGRESMKVAPKKPIRESPAPKKPNPSIDPYKTIRPERKQLVDDAIKKVHGLYESIARIPEGPQLDTAMQEALRGLDSLKGSELNAVAEKVDSLYLASKARSDDEKRKIIRRTLIDRRGRFERNNY